MSENTEMVVIIRPSFMKFCQDGCRAAALNHILYWIGQKAKGQPVECIQNGEIHWYASNDEIAGSLLAWGGCKVRIEVNKLLAMGLIGQSQSHKWGSGNRSKHFIFSKDQCAKLLALCLEYHINILQIGLPDCVLRLIQATTTDEILRAGIQKLLTPSKNREQHPLDSSHTSSNFRGTHPLNLEITSSKSREPKTKDYTKVSYKEYSSSTASESENEEQNDNDSPSLEKSSLSDPSATRETKAEQSVNPSVKENGRETQDACVKTPIACFKDASEQSVWQAICAWRGVKGDTPKAHERPEVKRLVTILQENETPIEHFTGAFIETAKQYAWRIKPFLKKDPKWYVCNIANELPAYLATQLKVKPRATGDTPGTYTFLAKTEDYLRLAASGQHCDDEEAMTVAQKYYEKFALNEEEFDMLIGDALIVASGPIHTHGGAWLQCFKDIMDEKQEPSRQLITA